MEVMAGGHVVHAAEVCEVDRVVLSLSPSLSLPLSYSEPLTHP